MNKLLIAVALLSFGTAHAQSGKADKPAAAPSGAAAAPSGAAAMPEMAPAKPGPETDALKPFVHNIQSSGTMVAGAMGPGSPEIPTKGKATCKWMMGNLWAMCDIEDTAGTGKTAMKWMGHWMFGWDTASKSYRGVMLDNMGMMMPMKGTLEGTKMTWESTTEMKIPNMPSKVRFSMDAADPKNIKFTDEGMMGGKWMVRGTGVHKMAGGK